MKRKVLFFLFSLIFSSIYAQEEVRSGKIVYVPEFGRQEFDGNAVFGIKTDSLVYVLTTDNIPLFGKGKFEAAEQTFSMGDSVEISGLIHNLIDNNTVTFSALEIKNINILAAFSSENISGTYTGILVSIPNPATEIPVMPGMVMGLECNGVQYILKGEARYEEGDSVEIDGVLSTHIDLLNNIYFELKINAIRKIEKENITANRTSSEVDKIFYDSSFHNLVIESDMRPDRLEVFDARGRCVMKEERPSGNVSVARLPHGLYLYRLTTAGTTLSGKFVR